LCLLGVGGGWGGVITCFFFELFNTRGVSGDGGAVNRSGYNREYQVYNNIEKGYLEN
jgi:hypothetical protein